MMVGGFFSQASLAMGQYVDLLAGQLIRNGIFAVGEIVGNNYNNDNCNYNKYFQMCLGFPVID